MAREAELPDGTILEFPDDTPDEVIDRAVQSHLRAAAPPKTMEELTPGISTDPSDGRNWGQNFAASYGGAIPGLVRGAQQFGTETAQRVAQAYGIDTPALGAEVQRLRTRADEMRELEAPLEATSGGFWGGLAGNVAPMMVAPNVAPVTLGRLAPYANAAIQGGAFGALQEVGEGQSRGLNALLGAGLGAGGQAVAGGLGRLATRATEKLSPVVREGIERARQLGIPLNASQTSASPAVKAAQAASQWLPLSGAASARKAQQEAFNRAVGKTFGADAPTLSDDVMKAARQKLSAEFNDIYARNDVSVTPDTMRRLLAIERESGENMSSEEAQIVRNQIERIVRESGDGQMTGDKYQSVRSLIQRAESRGGDVGRVIRQVRKELDDAAAQSVGPKDAARLAAVRSGWANMRTTEESLKQVAGAAGNVRPASLYPLVRNGSTKEMRELAQIGQNVLKDGLPDSGTAQRLLYQSLLTGGAGIGGGLAALGTLGKFAAYGAVAGQALNSKVASKLLQQGRPTKALAGLARPAPRALPVLTPQAAALLGLSRDEEGVLNIGTVHGQPGR